MIFMLSCFINSYNIESYWLCVKVLNKQLEILLVGSCVTSSLYENALFEFLSWYIVIF